MSIVWRWATGSLLPLVPITNRYPPSGTRLPDARAHRATRRRLTGARLPLARVTNRSSSSGTPLPHARRQPEVRCRATGNLRQATGTPLPPKRKRETENRNLLIPPPYPPEAGNALDGEEEREPRSRSGLDSRLSGVAGMSAAVRVLSLPVAAESRGHVAGSPARSAAVNGAFATPSGSPKVVNLESAAVEEGGRPGAQSKQREGPLTTQNAGPPSARWSSRQGTRKSREKGNGTNRQSATKDYTVGATRDEDLPDWASGWRERAHVAE